MRAATSAEGVPDSALTPVAVMVPLPLFVLIVAISVAVAVPDMVELKLVGSFPPRSVIAWETAAAVPFIAVTPVATKLLM